MQRTSTT